MSITDLDPAAMAALIKQLSMSDVEKIRAQLATPVPIREWVAYYLANLRTESDCTPVNYESTLRLFAAHVEAHGSCVSKAIIESFLTSRAEFGRSSNGANTWNRHLSAIRSMFKFLVNNEVDTDCRPIYQQQAMAVDRMTKPVDEPHPLAHVDFMAIFNSDLAMDERVWLGFLYYVGLRRFEVASLQVGQVDVSGPYSERGLHGIRRKGRGDRRFGNVPYGLMASLIAKTFPDTVGRNARLWLDCVEEVVRTRGPEPDTLICVRADDRDQAKAARFKWINDDFNALCTKYGVTTHYKVHDLRDSASTNLKNVPGLSADLRMKWMAHQDKATNDLYTQFDDADGHHLL